MPPSGAGGRICPWVAICLAQEPHSGCLEEALRLQLSQLGLTAGGRRLIHSCLGPRPSEASAGQCDPHQHLNSRAGDLLGASRAQGHRQKHPAARELCDKLESHQGGQREAERTNEKGPGLRPAAHPGPRKDG